MGGKLLGTDHLLTSFVEEKKHTLSLYSEWAFNHTVKKDHHHNLLLHLAQLVYLVMLQRKKSDH